MSRTRDFDHYLRGRYQGATGATLQHAVYHRGPCGAPKLLKSDICRSLLSWWYMADPGRVPCRCAFDITEHPSLAPYLFVVDFPEPGAYRFRLVGEIAKAIIGFNTTGVVLRRGQGTDQDQMLIAYYDEIISTRKPWSCLGSLEGTRGFEAIDCPLTLTGSDQVGALIGALVLVD